MEPDKRASLSLKSVLIFPIALLAPLLFADGLRAEAVWSSAATKWNCTSGTRPEWDDMCREWRKKMGAFGYTKKRANYSRMVVFRYTDPALEDWGKDNTEIDSAFAAMMCTHGRYPRDLGWRAVMHHSTHHMCELTVAQRKYGRASGGSLRFLHLSSCHSMNWDTRHTWDSAADGGVHIVMGFHGRMFIGSDFVPDYLHQASDGQNYPGVAWAWVTNMYHAAGFAGRAYQQCPVARAYGDSDERAYQVLSERYGDNLDDSAPVFAYNLFIGGCQPGSTVDGHKPVPPLPTGE
jgi:hypothetical protein